MGTIAGMTPERMDRGPWADIVELVDADKRRFAAFIPHPELARHPELGAFHRELKDLLTNFGVRGVANLVAYDAAHGAFVYDTPRWWTLNEVLGRCGELATPPGMGASLQLMRDALAILEKASPVGARNDIPSHGGINPWSLLLEPTGELCLIGYGLPPVDLYKAEDDDAFQLSEQSVRYAPPERLLGASEDFTSDLYSLCLVVFEMVTGQPMHSGLPGDVLAKAKRGDVNRRLFVSKKALGDDLYDLLRDCLRPDPADRPNAPADLVADLDDMIAGLERKGTTLAGLTKVMSSASRVAEATVMAGQTVAGSQGANRDPVERIWPQAESWDQQRETTPFRVRLGQDGPRHQVRLPKDATIAEAAALLWPTLAPLRVDAEGRLVAGYRLGPLSGPARGDTPLAEARRWPGLVLHSVPARQADVRIRVEIDGSTKTKHFTVNTAMPVASLVDVLRRDMDDRDSGWCLFHKGRRLAPQLLLDEVDLADAALDARKE